MHDLKPLLPSSKLLVIISASRLFPQKNFISSSNLDYVLNLLSNTTILQEELTSAAIAILQNSSIENFEKSTALTTVGFPAVNVPVLSKTTVFTYKLIYRCNKNLR